MNRLLYISAVVLFACLLSKGEAPSCWDGREAIFACVLLGNHEE